MLWECQIADSLCFCHTLHVSQAAALAHEGGLACSTTAQSFIRASSAGAGRCALLLHWTFAIAAALQMRLARIASASSPASPRWICRIVWASRYQASGASRASSTCSTWPSASVHSKHIYSKDMGCCSQEPQMQHFGLLGSEDVSKHQTYVHASALPGSWSTCYA